MRCCTPRPRWVLSDESMRRVRMHESRPVIGLRFSQHTKLVGRVRRREPGNVQNVTVLLRTQLASTQVAHVGQAETGKWRPAAGVLDRPDLPQIEAEPLGRGSCRPGICYPSPIGLAFLQAARVDWIITVLSHRHSSVTERVSRSRRWLGGASHARTASSN